MEEIIGEGLGFLTEVMKYINTKNATKYTDEGVDIQKQLLAEEAKPYGSQDDDLVARLRAQYAVTTAAAKQEFIAWAATQKTA